MICRNVEMQARVIDDLLDLTRVARVKRQTLCGGDIVFGASKADFEVLFAWHHLNKKLVYPRVNQRGANTGSRLFNLQLLDRCRLETDAERDHAAGNLSADAAVR